MAGDRLAVCEQELLQAFACLVSISSNFLSEKLTNKQAVMHCSKDRLTALVIT